MNDNELLPVYSPEGERGWVPRFKWNELYADGLVDEDDQWVGTQTEWEQMYTECS